MCVGLIYSIYAAEATIPRRRDHIAALSLKLWRSTICLITDEMILFTSYFTSINSSHIQSCIRHPAGVYWWVKCIVGTLCSFPGIVVGILRFLRPVTSENEVGIWGSDICRTSVLLYGVAWSEFQEKFGSPRIQTFCNLLRSNPLKC